MTGEVVQFNADNQETAPALVGSALAVKERDGSLAIDQMVVLVADETLYGAESKALNLALRKWRIADGWSKSPRGSYEIVTSAR